MVFIRVLLTSFVALVATFPGVLLRGGDIGPVSGRGGNGSHVELIILLVIIVIGMLKAFFTLQRLVRIGE